MAISLQSYSVGTVSVTNGSKVVNLAGAGAAWLAAFAVGGNQFVLAGEAQVNYVAERVSNTQVLLALPVARATAAGLTYAMLLTAPAFGTNFEAASTNVERIRLQAENAALGHLAAGDAAIVAAAVGDLVHGLDVSNGNSQARLSVLSMLLTAKTTSSSSASIVVSATDFGKLWRIDAAGAARSVRLPEIADVYAGFEVIISKSDVSANLVSILAAVTDGGTTVDTITEPGGTLQLRCDGVGWRIIGQFVGSDALDAMAALTPAAGKFVRFSGANQAVMQDIVGSVAQVGGVPSGALFESGSNANGTWMRLADGTQICWLFTGNLASIPINSGDEYAWTYPIAFAAAPAISANSYVATGSVDGRAGRISMGLAAVTTATARAHFWNTYTVALAPRLHIIATGRWFN